MSKILLINAPVREFAQPNNPPLGLMYIASYLNANGHSCHICDLNALRTINPDIALALDMFKMEYDIIGMSGLVTTAGAQRHILNYILDNKKAFGDPLLISGGGLASSAPEFTLRLMPELDALVVGEGEATALDLASGLPPPNIPGVYVKGHAFVPRKQIPRLDDLPFPDHSLIPVETYLKNPVWGISARNSSRIGYQMKRSLSMIASRGCPFTCKFCYHDVFGKKYRTRSIGNVIEEMRSLKEQYDVDFIGFVDDNTIANMEWSLEFCNALIEADLGIHWGCHARVDEVDPELLKLMKLSGCEYIGFGVESANVDILKAMNKKATAQEAEQAIRWVREAGMWANATFIAGFPGENVKTLWDTARFMKDNDMLGSCFFATAYPGTELYEDSKDKILAKYGTEDAYIMSLGDATEFRINLSDMDEGDLYLYMQMAIGGIPFSDAMTIPF